MPNRDGRHRKIIKNIPLISILIWLGLTIVLVSTVTAQFGLFFNYLPVVMKPYPTPTPTRTPTVTPTRTPTRTPTATIARTGNIDITTIVYDFDGTSQPNEYVEIKNVDNKAINLLDWRLHDYGDRHSFTFPQLVMQPNQVCRIYTNVDTGLCGLSFGNEASIWNDGGDQATLLNYLGQVVDTYTYGNPQSAMFDQE